MSGVVAAGQEAEPKSAYHRTVAYMPAANAELPGHVEASAGRLTLFADFAHEDADGVPLYLVNRTDESVAFGSQDGDILMKLERQLPDGSWQRVQAHIFSWCGNSYGTRTLAPGMHYVMKGYQPETGERAKVRYASYGDVEVVSNAGEGRFLGRDAWDAALDRMSLRGVPRHIQEFLEAGKDSMPIPNRTLSSHLAAVRAAVLLGEIPLVRTRAGEWLQQVQGAALAGSPEAKVATRLEEILGRDWGPRTESLEPLLKACLAALKANVAGPQGADADFGSLATEPEFVWWLVYDIGSIEFAHEERQRVQPRSDPAIWREVMNLTVQTAATAQEPLARPAGVMLSIRTLVDEFLPDAALEPLLGKDHCTHSIAAAFARRGRWERLAELGLKLDPKQQVIVLGKLAGERHPEGKFVLDGFGGLRLPPEGTIEKTFWAHVIKTQPVQAAATLQSKVDQKTDPRQVFHGELFEPLSTYWRK